MTALILVLCFMFGSAAAKNLDNVRSNILNSKVELLLIDNTARYISEIKKSSTAKDVKGIIYELNHFLHSQHKSEIELRRSLTVFQESLQRLTDPAKSKQVDLDNIDQLMEGFLMQLYEIVVSKDAAMDRLKRSTVEYQKKVIAQTNSDDKQQLLAATAWYLKVIPAPKDINSKAERLFVEKSGAYILYRQSITGGSK